MQDSEYKPGLVVDVDCVDGKSHKAQLCELPMYDPKGEIVLKMLLF